MSLEFWGAGTARTLRPIWVAEGEQDAHICTQTSQSDCHREGISRDDGSSRFYKSSVFGYGGNAT